MATFNDLTGHRYSRIAVLSYAGVNARRQRTWNVRCDCGHEWVVIAGHLRAGTTTSCGCLGREIASRTHRTHGQSLAGRGGGYYCWSHMKQRCYQPNMSKYANYGGRGIRVCDRWINDFSAFLEDMGPRPSLKHSIERVDPDGHYEPGNCHWADIYEQNNNKRSNRRIPTPQGDMTVAQAARAYDVPQSRLYSRLRMGWPLEKILGPVKTSRWA